MRNPESPAATLAFAAAVAFVCALIVSSAVYWLRPIQLAAQSMDYTRAVVAATRVATAQEPWSDREIISRFLDFEVRLVDVREQRIAGSIDPAAYDYRADLAGSARERPRYMPAYLLREDGRIVMAVLPFYGPGMWSTIHGLVALEGDFATVVGVAIYDHGETPGIGDRIQAPEWQAGWRGRRLYDADGKYRFRVGASSAQDNAPFAVDAISGATITVKGVDRAMGAWFGDEGYAPVLASLREENR